MDGFCWIFRWCHQQTHWQDEKIKTRCKKTVWIIGKWQVFLTCFCFPRPNKKVMTSSWSIILFLTQRQSASKSSNWFQSWAALWVVRILSKGQRSFELLDAYSSSYWNSCLVFQLVGNLLLINGWIISVPKKSWWAKLEECIYCYSQKKKYPSFSRQKVLINHSERIKAID